MSKTTRLFNSVPVEQQKASSFDMSFYSCGTGMCGTLTPVFKQEIIPGDLISLGIMSQIDLPPMATSPMGRIDMRYEAFFVPNRITWGGWEAYKTRQSDDPYAFQQVSSSVLPFISISDSISLSETQLSSILSKFGAGSLADYLGYRVDSPAQSDAFLHTNSLGVSNVIIDNALPFLAYHKIYDDWYRSSQIQKPLFVRLSSDDNLFHSLSNFPWRYFSDSPDDNPCILLTSDGSSTTNSLFYNRDSILSMHQRCWSDDLYTTLALYPQAALNPQSPTINVRQAQDKTVTGVTMTIPSLRAANILQRYKEIMNLAGERYPDQLFAEYGVRPADAILDRPLFLGAYSHGVYTSSIYQNSNTAPDQTSVSEKNPFRNCLGSSAGDSNGFGKNSLVNGFKATEHGYVIVIGSLVPHSFYSNGVDYDLMHSTIGDIASPKMQGLGEQAIYTNEIIGAHTDGVTTIFGYTPQYSHYKYRNDEVHGRLRSTPHLPESVRREDLKYFCLQRTINDLYETMSSSFIEIPTDFLDQVFAVTTANSGYSYMYYIQWQLKMTRPLAEYVIPTLGDPKDTYTTRIPLRGKQIKG